MTNELICDNDYWVEGLKNNLLSVAQLNNIGFKEEFMDGKDKLLDGKGNLVGFAKQTKGNLFYLDLLKVHVLFLKYKKVGCGTKDYLVKIRKHKRVRGIPSLKKPDMGLCKNCQIGKMGKTSFKRKHYNSQEILELCIHTYVGLLE